MAVGRRGRQLLRTVLDIIPMILLFPHLLSAHSPQLPYRNLNNDFVGQEPCLR
jgi:hypothetical protein